jgi:secreted PhoX family phosphatase
VSTIDREPIAGSEDEVTNPSDNDYIGDIIAAVVSRRGVLGGSLAAAAGTFFGGAAVLAGAGPSGAADRDRQIGFTPLAPTDVDDVTLAPGYSYDVLYAWGDPIVPSGPQFRQDASNTAAEQAVQAGQGHDGMWYFPIGSSADVTNFRGLLAINHEYTLEDINFPDGEANWDAEKTQKSLNSHGISVIEVASVNGTWQVVESPLARRITGETPMAITGPAAGHPLLRTNADPAGTTVLGTLNNCAKGQTPWGTYLTDEENFNQYFHNGGVAPADGTLDRRYGIPATSNYLWYTTDDRFDVTKEPNENHRFGWVVEIDPYDASSMPAKRTALGRLKHEGSEVTIGPDGQAVVYMGDDQANDYVYKFIGAESIDAALNAGRSPLDEGTLYVARFNANGSGDWLPLVQGQGPLTAANGFADQGDVLVKTRLAADLLGPTKMDRPEWTTIHPRTGAMYFTCTNNTGRTVPDAANPRAPNPYGHIISLREKHANNAGVGFNWAIYLLAGDPPSGATIPADQAFGSPDGLWFDRDGRLWIQTDGRQPPVPLPGGGTIVPNDQMLASDPATGDLRRFLVGPRDCEVTGVTTTPNGRTMFVNIQHPGDGGTTENPRLTSNWPDFLPNGRPRPATIVITKDDGGVVGS